MKSTFTVLFYLRKNRLNNQGQAPIMVRITINGEMSQFSIKLHVDPEQWDTKSGRAKGRSADSTNLNRLLDNLKAKIDTIYTKEFDRKGYVLPETIKNILSGFDVEHRKTLLEYFREHNEQYKLKVGITTSQKTYSRYELTRSKLSEFIRIKYRLSDIMLSEINYIFIENFYLYLLNHSCNNNTAMKFVQRLRTIFTYAINSGADIKVNPFANFKFRYDAVNREVLSQQEIDFIYTKKFASKRLTQVRDLFIFCCFTNLEDKKQRKANHGNGLIVRNERPLMALSA